MLTELQTNLEAILNEKNTKIIPANIKSGITIFNVTGTAVESNEEPSKNVTITEQNQEIEPSSNYTGMSKIVATVSSAIDSNIQAANIRENISILGVTGTAKIIPTGIGIQTTTPAKETDEMIWLQESTVSESSFIGNIPNEVLQWTSSANKTVTEFILALDSSVQTNIDNYNKHLLFVNGDTIYLIASDTLYYDLSNNATVTFDNTEKVFITYTSSGIVDYSSDTTVSTTQMLSANNKYTDKNIYNTAGTIITVPAYVDTTNYLGITVNDKKYEVQINRGNQFNKILDTSDGNITAADVRTGKIGYSNNQKITGTMESIPNGVFIQEETPTKSTSEAIWLKEEKYKNSDLIPNDAIFGDKTWAEIKAQLTPEQLATFDNYEYLFAGSGSIHYIIVAFNSPSKVIANVSGLHIAGLSSKNTSVTYWWQSWQFNNTIEFSGDIYDTDYISTFNLQGSSGSIVLTKNAVKSNDTNGLHIDVDGTRYIVHTNKNSSWDKILDTSNANATANDIVSGKTAFVNNVKITGTFAGVDSSDATATSVDICAGKTAYINNVKITGTGAMTFATVSEMNQVTTVPEDTLAIVYGDTYVGTYRFDNGSWTEIGSASTGQTMMNNLNEVMGDTDQYEGLGGTEEEINEVFDDILGNEEE